MGQIPTKTIEQKPKTNAKDNLEEKFTLHASETGFYQSNTAELCNKLSYLTSLGSNDNTLDLNSFYLQIDYNRGSGRKKNLDPV